MYDLIAVIRLPVSINRFWRFPSAADDKKGLPGDNIVTFHDGTQEKFWQLQVGEAAMNN